MRGERVMSNTKKKLPLAFWIFTGLLLGILAGMGLMKTPEIATTYIKPFGTLFLNLVKFIVVPIVLFSIMSGVISMRDIRKVGSIGVKTIVYYMCTTALAVVIGLALANAFKGSFGEISASGLEYSSPEADISPKLPLNALASARPITTANAVVHI